MKRESVVLFVLLALVSCGTNPVQDQSPGSLESGHKRVETKICERHEVGENGCVYKKGELSGELQVYFPESGLLTIQGSGCGVDRSFQFEKDGSRDEWLSIQLRDLIPDGLQNDCVLTLQQKLEPDLARRLEFPLRELYGTVTLGTCPDGVVCEMDFTQQRADFKAPVFVYTAPAEGQYLLRGCGQEVVPVTDFDGSFTLNLGSLWPGGYPQDKGSCQFILSVRYGIVRLKKYMKYNLYSPKYSELAMPEFEHVGRKIKFKSERIVLFAVVDGKLSRKDGEFRPRSEGNFIRLYTSQGRSLVIFYKEGVVQWKK